MLWPLSMTLRTWAFLLLVGLYFLVTAQANASYSNPSVWEQMQFNPHRVVKAQVKAIQVDGESVKIEIASPGSKEITSVILCTNENQEPFRTNGRPTEPVRAVYQAERISLLREAFKSGEAVELGFSGPWSPCLNTVRMSKGA